MGKNQSKPQTSASAPDLRHLEAAQRDFGNIYTRWNNKEEDLTGFVFSDWVKQNGLTDATVATLRKEDLTTRRALSLLQPEDIVSFSLTVGQKRSLEFAIRELRDTDKPTSRALTPPSKDNETGRRMVRALYDFKSAEKTDLNFSKGDLMELLDIGNWCLAKKQDGTEGYVPFNYVALENTMESMDWFFGPISRPESEQILRADDVDVGSFLIRESLREKGFVLSFRGPQEAQMDKPVKHCRILGSESERFYLSPKRRFHSLDELVQHYKERADGLPCPLTSPCPRPKPVQQDLSKETEDVWEIDRSTLTFCGTPIGSGHFGEVWRGMWKDTTEVAIKKMKEDTVDAKQFLAEAAIMKKLKHQNLVKLYAVCSRQEPFLIVIEFMRNGSLLHYLRHGDGRNCTFSQLTDMAAQVAAGMAYLEENNVIHRDLTARNVLVGEHNVVKVTDFGFARLIKDGVFNPKDDKTIPVKWTAPEVMFKHKCTSKSDVWSFGVLLHEIMTKGQEPYVGMSKTEVISALRNGYRMEQHKAVPDVVYAMMMQCWDEDEEKRPSFTTLQRFCLECPSPASRGTNAEDHHYRNWEDDCPYDVPPCHDDE